MLYVAVLDFRHFGFVWKTANGGRQRTVAVWGEGEYGGWQPFKLCYKFILNSVSIIMWVFINSFSAAAVSHELQLHLIQISVFLQLPGPKTLTTKDFTCESPGCFPALLLGGSVGSFLLILDVWKRDFNQMMAGHGVLHVWELHVVRFAIGILKLKKKQPDELLKQNFFMVTGLFFWNPLKYFLFKFFALA